MTADPLDGLGNAAKAALFRFVRRVVFGSIRDEAEARAIWERAFRKCPPAQRPTFRAACLGLLEGETHQEVGEYLVSQRGKLTEPGMSFTTGLAEIRSRALLDFWREIVTG